mmetsp:Transcript_451/g.549  ORF Transcript_451/g.549 Transcript_451/m.549 type:complete len:233 (+) Transcript_451:30-728(+)
MDDRSDNSEDLDDRKAKRLERNRESARRSRKKKNMYMQYLEEKVSKLQDEAKNLRSSLSETAAPSIYTNTVKMFQQLRCQLHGPESDVQASLNALDKRFGTTGQERLDAIDYFFSQVVSLLLPTYAKSMLWSSYHNQDISIENLTAEQEAALMELRPALASEYLKFSECVQELESVRDELKCLSKDLDSTLQELRKVLTPHQVARFLLWLEDNKHSPSARELCKEEPYSSSV